MGCKEDTPKEESPSDPLPQSLPGYMFPIIATEGNGWAFFLTVYDFLYNPLKFFWNLLYMVVRTERSWAADILHGENFLLEVEIALNYLMTCAAIKKKKKKKNPVY